MEKPWKVIFAFVAVFIAGAIFGGVFSVRAVGKRFGGERPAAIRAEKQRQGGQNAQAGVAPGMMRQLTQRLNLTAEQREKIRPILARATEDWQRYRRENIENITRVNERMYADVAAQLSPEQRVELESMRGRMQERIRHAREKLNPAKGDAPARPNAAPPPRS